MQHSKGSLGLIFLLCLFWLTCFAQLMLYYLKADYGRTLTYTQNLQQRYLCSSLERWFVRQEEMIDTLNFQYTLIPSTEELTVQGIHSVSSDTFFEHYKTQVAMGIKQQLLNRLVFHPGEQLQALGQQYMFISQYELQGKEYLTEGQLFTSGELITLPKLDFLATRVPTGCDMTTIHENGFSNGFLYTTQKLVFTYDNMTAKTKGNAFIASTQEIVFKKNFYAPNRLIIISNGSVTLETNVQLKNVLIIANGNVNINAGCTINGVIFSNSYIKLLGKGNFTYDGNVVADFASAYFIA